VAFSTPPEVQTFAALTGALAPLGYSVSQKARVLDYVRAAAENPKATLPVGSSLGDFLIPGLRATAGPFGPGHPWLRPSDWDYAFRAHFDFVVHEGIMGEHPTHPLFAVEFDGAAAHARPAARWRDLAKNRLCAAAGLPLVRINDTFLYPRERLSLVEWLARLWAAYRAEMPDLLAERDATVEAMPQAQLDEAGLFLLAEYPHLDAELTFELGHPFPPAQEVAERLASQYGFFWFEVEVRSAAPLRRRWKVARCIPPVSVLSDGLIERWRCELSLTGPVGQTTTLQGIADVPRGYPLDEGPVVDSWAALLAGRLPYLPAGPWTTATSLLGKALCVHNTLIEVERYLRRNDRQ
jgi:hypothetical protein